MAVQAFSGTANFADCDPPVPIHTFDHNTAATSSVSLGAAAPKASHCLPVFCIAFINNALPLPFCLQVREVVGFLVVFSENVHYTIVDLGDRIYHLFLPP